NETRRRDSWISRFPPRASMKLDLSVSKQPDDESCGITCLQAIYDYYDHPTTLEKLKHEVDHWRTGGTLAVNLARHALNHGFRAEIYTFNITIFDPTWKKLETKDLLAKLKLRQSKIRSKRQKKVIGYYKDFLKKGGTIRFD